MRNISTNPGYYLGNGSNILKDDKTKISFKKYIKEAILKHENKYNFCNIIPQLFLFKTTNHSRLLQPICEF